MERTRLADVARVQNPEVLPPPQQSVGVLFPALRLMNARTLFEKMKRIRVRFLLRFSTGISRGRFVLNAGWGQATHQGLGLSQRASHVFRRFGTSLLTQYFGRAVYHSSPKLN
jgi:hypothetical protein